MTAQRRVLFLASAPFFSGAERALVLTLQSLDRSQYEPTVIAGTDGEFAAQVRALGIGCDVIPLWQLDRSNLLRTMTSLLRVTVAARRLRPALIHSNDMISYQPGGLAARFLRIPCVTHLRFPVDPDGYRWFFRPRFSKAILISEAFQDEVCRDAPDLFRGRTVVIYDPVQVPSVWSADEIAARRRDLGLPVDRPVVALTGQVAKVKGIWEFIDAANRLRRTDAVFAVLGDDLQTGGALRQRMEQRVSTLGLDNRFSFLGFRSDAPSIGQVFDVVAAPSHVEPFGLASLEAMASGRPVVASRVGGIPEVVVDGVTGLLVPPKNAEALAEALTRLLADPALRRQMGEAGRRRATEVFSLEAHGRTLEGLYDQLLGSSR